MDRRTFLRSSAALAVASAAGELKTVAQQDAPHAEHPMAPPVVNQAVAGDLKPFTWEAAGLLFGFEFAGNRLRFRNVLPQGVAAIDGVPAPAEMSGLETSLHCTGEDVPDHHGAKFSGAYPGCRMVFAGKHEETTPRGKQLVLRHRDEVTGLEIESVYVSTGDIAVVRRFTRIRNTGARPVGIEYVSSAMLNNFANSTSFQQDLVLHFAFNSWQAEAQWRSVPLAEAGLVQNGNFSVSGASFTSVGSWPSERYLPMAMLENKRAGVTWFWQVEHNGSWHCEIAQTGARSLYAYFGGPDAQHAQAWKQLNAGEEYETVPVAVGCVQGGFERAVAELTRYRRATQLHPRSDTRDCPVVFNDVIALQGDQSTAGEMPLIDAAASAGCEVYCMDVGWCTRPGENWWNPVGDWVVDAKRFPGGLRKLTDSVRAKGMVPGLWIEPEVAGLWTSVARRPDSWFFMRHGRRIIDHTRYQLDYRNPDVRAYIDRVFDRLVREYGIGYIKLDYNINAHEGTGTGAESFGQGLLGHNRAFLSWLDALLDRYPDLTLETVASGGMRMDHTMLSRAQLQSISDADDYRAYASLVPGCSAALLPEQMGVWSQPQEGRGPDAASCNMVNAMLGRIHQSGFINRLAPAELAQVRKGIAVYKNSIRRYIPRCTPFYPLGMADLTAPERPSALGMRSPEKTFVAVWRRNGPEKITLRGVAEDLQVLYPSDLEIRVTPEAQATTVEFPRPFMACILSS